MTAEYTFLKSVHGTLSRMDYVLGHKSLKNFKGLKSYQVLFFLIFGCVGSCCCVRAFSSCGRWGLLFAAVHGLLIAVVFLVAEHGL